jgi:hypothetical protein
MHLETTDDRKGALRICLLLVQLGVYLTVSTVLTVDPSRAEVAYGSSFRLAH